MGWWQDIMNARKNREEVERLTRELERFELTKEEIRYIDLKKEIESIEQHNLVKQEFDQTLEITKLAQAEEYNRTLQILSESEVATTT